MATEGFIYISWQTGLQLRPNCHLTHFHLRMLSSVRGVLGFLAAATALLSVSVDAREMRKEDIRAAQHAAAKRWHSTPHRRDAAAAPAQNLTFNSAQAKSK